MIRSRLSRLLGRSFSAAALLVVVAVPQATFGQKRDSSPGTAEKMSATWSRTVPITLLSPNDKVGEWRVWIEEGWLVVERRTNDRKIEWKIVLAKVVGDEPPEITTHITTVRLNYGRYFIYEFSRSEGETQIGCLRCRRQRKTDDEHGPAVHALPRDSNQYGSFSSRNADNWSLCGRVSDSWVTVTAGTHQNGEQPFPDCLVRLFHTDLKVPEHGGGMGGDSLYQYYGKWFVEDDGEILVASRLEAWMVSGELAFQAKGDPALAARLAIKKLGGAPAPELSGDVWLNADESPTWRSLRGKTVLLVLFDLRQPSFMSLVPPLLTFQDAYSKQGLAVIGVYAKAPRDDIARHVAEEHITFPVLIDDGKTAERYGVGYGACVLIDRDGKAVAVYKNSLAPPAEIEKLLEAR